MVGIQSAIAHRRENLYLSSFSCLKRTSACDAAFNSQPQPFDISEGYRIHSCEFTPVAILQQATSKKRTQPTKEPKEVKSITWSSTTGSFWPSLLSLCHVTKKKDNASVVGPPFCVHLYSHCALICVRMHLLVCGRKSGWNRKEDRGCLGVGLGNGSMCPRGWGVRQVMFRGWVMKAQVEVGEVLVVD